MKLESKDVELSNLASITGWQAFELGEQDDITKNKEADEAS